MRAQNASRRVCVFDVRVYDVKRRQLRETVLTTSSDATMERALTDRCDATDATTVLTAATNSVVVSQCIYSSVLVFC